MTVVAWDGVTLAADKQATMFGLKTRVTKIQKVNGELLFSCGDFGYVKQMVKWYENGADPEKFPECQKDKEDFVTLYVVKKNKEILCYEKTPHPFVIDEPFFACGSGRDYAIAAMSLGHNAVTGVEIAIRFETSCGLGIDTLTLDGA